jgi:ELWxxDGT repeat protein
MPSLPWFSCGIRAMRPAVLLLGLTAWPAGAAEPVLVADLVTVPDQTASSIPRSTVVYAGAVYFVAEDDLHGAELWRTDGTPAGTVRVTDACPGRCTAEPVALAVAGGRLYFLANDGATGREVWVSDGTAAGTRRLADICPGPCHALPPGTGATGFAPVAVGGEVFFSADDGTTGRELWKTDGTRAGTVQVADLAAGPASSEPSALVAFDGELVFQARDDAHGLELWASDGTAAGTRLRHDFCPGPCHSVARPVIATGGRLLVELVIPAVGQAPLWILDTAGGVQPDTVLGGIGRSTTHAVVWGDRLLVSVRPTGESARLWRTDLTAGGSTLLGDYDTRAELAPLVPAGNKAFFSNGTPASGLELWVTDGTPQGTREVRDLRPAAGSEPWDITAFGDRVVFTAFTDAAGHEPWISDGTAAGTLPLGDLVPDFGPFGPLSSLAFDYAVVGGRLVFSADRPEGDRELWVSTGSAAGTALLADLRRGTGGGDPLSLTPWHGEVYFSAAGESGGRKPWKSDGSAAGTAPLDGVGVVMAPPYERFVPFAGWLHFVAGREVWRTAGRPGLTAPIPGPYRFARDLVSAGTRLFLLAEVDGDLCFFNCHEPHWLLPGGTVELVEDIDPGTFQSPVTPQPEQPASSQGHDLTAFDGRLFLGANDGLVEEGGGGHGDEPWVSDGTAAGTGLLADTCPGACDGTPTPFGRLGRRGDLVFGAGPLGQPAVWRTDGTPAGTVEVAGLPYPGARPREGVSLRSRIHFLLRGPAGDELWASDGTAAGTARVSDLTLPGGSGFHTAQGLTAAGGLLFLAVHHDATGEELWASDGTAAGTRLVADIAPGPAGAAPQSLTRVDSRLAFAASDGATGLELWVSDGTAAGTLRLTDLAPGRDSSSPAEITAVGPLLYFVADDGVHGRELWTLPRAALGPPRKVLPRPLF